MIAGQAAAICIFGTALYLAIAALRKKGVRVFLDDTPKAETSDEKSSDSEREERKFSDSDVLQK